MSQFSCIQQQVWNVVQELNRAWTIDKTPEKLHDFFHDRMIAITPVDRLRREG